MSLHDPLNPIFPGIPGTVLIASNSALSVYATLFLTIRLLAHRMLVTAYQGSKALMKQRLRIVTILLESAAINVPIAIAAAVGLKDDKTFSAVLGFICPPSQVRDYSFPGYRILRLA